MSFENTGNVQETQEIAEKISAISGIKISLRILQKLQSLILENSRSKSLKSPNEYITLLLKNTPEGKKELSKIIDNLVNLETSFFRDKMFFNDLKTIVLPELINQNKKDKQLKIWSAGCSTGEEPLTFAMVLHELLYDLDDWKITILGTDISNEAINKAKNGKFNSKSVKSIDPVTLKKFFVKEDDAYFANNKIMSMVSYKTSNLVTDPYNFTNHSFDLIICRNVFIYFQPKAVEEVIDKMSKVLKPHGVLITGHGELIGIKHQLKMELLSNCVIFRKK